MEAEAEGKQKPFASTSLLCGILVVSYFFILLYYILRNVQSRSYNLVSLHLYTPYLNQLNFFPFGGKPIYTLCLSCHSIMSAVTQHYIVLSTFCQLPILLAEINE